MGRSLKTAKTAGAKFETDIAAYLAQQLGQPAIERRHLTGALDRGDITGMFINGQRVVVECKNYGGRLELGSWINELETEMVNDKAQLGFITAKRRGTTNPGEQWVAMTLDQFLRFVTNE